MSLDIFSPALKLPSSAPDELRCLCTLSDEAQKVALASALLWTYRSPTDLASLLALLKVKNGAQRIFTGSKVREVLTELEAQGLLSIEMGRTGSCFQLKDALRVALYAQLLNRLPEGELLQIILRIDEIDLSRMRLYWYGVSESGTIAFLRATLLSGRPIEEYRQIKALISRNVDWEPLVTEAVLQPFDRASFERIIPEIRWELACHAAEKVAHVWYVPFIPIVDYLFAELLKAPASLPVGLRMLLADLALQRGDSTLFESALQGVNNPNVSALRAAALVSNGQWAAGQVAFEAAIKEGQKEYGLRKRVFPGSISWLYPLALLAQGTPAHLELARKFCVGEAGKREPDPYGYWGRWSHAIDVRSGNATLVQGGLCRPFSDHSSSHPDLWAFLLTAWLGSDLQNASSVVKKRVEESFTQLRAQLQSCRFSALLGMLDNAKKVLDGGEPDAGFFIAARSEK